MVQIAYTIGSNSEPGLAIFSLRFFHLIHLALYQYLTGDGDHLLGQAYPFLLAVLICLEVVCTHPSIAAVTSQTLKTPVCSLLAWVEVFTIAFAVPMLAP